MTSRNSLFQVTLVCCAPDEDIYIYIYIYISWCHPGSPHLHVRITTETKLTQWSMCSKKSALIFVYGPSDISSNLPEVLLIDMERNWLRVLNIYLLGIMPRGWSKIPLAHRGEKPWYRNIELVFVHNGPTTFCSSDGYVFSGRHLWQFTSFKIPETTCLRQPTICQMSDKMSDNVNLLQKIVLPFIDLSCFSS